MPYTRRDVIKTLGLGISGVTVYSAFGSTFKDQSTPFKLSNTVARKGGRKTIVLNIGGGLVKAGFAGEDSPVAVFPAVVGRHRNKSLSSKSAKQEVSVGYKALAGNGYLSLSWPTESETINRWDDIQVLLQHAVVDKLKVDPQKYDLIVTESVFNTDTERAKMAEQCFKSLKPRSFHVSKKAELAAYASGKTTALVVSCGEQATHVVPVYEGQCMTQASMRLNVGGKVLDAHLEDMLSQRGYMFDALDKHFIIKDIKESMCYVSSQKALAASGSHRESYELADGQKVILSQERVRCPEALFQPTLAGVQQEGVHELIYRSLMKCDLPMREELLSNIVLEGGSTLFGGFTQRLQREVQNLVPRGMPVNMLAAEDRAHLTWKGASVLANLSTFDQVSVSQREYQMYGSKIVNQKCLNKSGFHLS